jgi:hypothetical protein
MPLHDSQMQITIGPAGKFPARQVDTRETDLSCTSPKRRLPAAGHNAAADCIHLLSKVSRP